MEKWSRKPLSMMRGNSEVLDSFTVLDGFYCFFSLHVVYQAHHCTISLNASLWHACKLANLLPLLISLLTHLWGLVSAEHELDSHQQVHSQLNKTQCYCDEYKANGSDNNLRPCNAMCETLLPELFMKPPLLYIERERCRKGTKREGSCGVASISIRLA